MERKRLAPADESAEQPQRPAHELEDNRARLHKTLRECNLISSACGDRATGSVGEVS